MHGQALHFRWGDGAKFECTELKDCFQHGLIRMVKIDKDLVEKTKKFRGWKRKIQVSQHNDIQNIYVE